MYLELAENCTNCLSENNDTLPIVDDQTGQVYEINTSAFAQLDPETQAEILIQAEPLLYIMMKDDFNGMEGALWDKIKSKVSGFVQKVKGAFGGGTGNSAQTGGMFSNMFSNQNQMQPNSGMINPKFGGSFNIEPDPKPWFARPEVMLPVVGGVVLIGVLAFKK